MLVSPLQCHLRGVTYRLHLGLTRGEDRNQGLTQVRVTPTPSISAAAGGGHIPGSEKLRTLCSQMHGTTMLVFWKKPSLGLCDCI